MKLGLLLVLSSSLSIFALQPQREPAATAGTLRQIIPGHYLYTSTRFNSGIIVTSDGVVVLDALESEAWAQQERKAISSVIQQPVRILISSPFHDNYSKGNVAYPDVFKIGHEDYRTDLLEEMQSGKASPAEQQARLPHQTYRDRLTLHLGGKEIQILHLGRAHTRGDSVVFVPQDKILYLSELFFAEQFPNMADGYGISWLKALDAAETLGAEIFVPGHGPIPDNPLDTRQSLQRARRILEDARDAVQIEIARGATEDQANETIKLAPYEKLSGFGTQREVVVRRMYRELTGKLP